MADQFIDLGEVPITIRELLHDLTLARNSAYGKLSWSRDERLMEGKRIDKQIAALKVLCALASHELPIDINV